MHNLDCNVTFDVFYAKQLLMFKGVIVTQRGTYMKNYSRYFGKRVT